MRVWKRNHYLEENGQFTQLSLGIPTKNTRNLCTKSTQVKNHTWHQIKVDILVPSVPRSWSQVDITEKGRMHEWNRITNKSIWRNRKSNVTLNGSDLPQYQHNTHRRNIYSLHPSLNELLSRTVHLDIYHTTTIPMTTISCKMVACIWYMPS